MSGLFRQEVVERQADRLHGDILVLPRFSHILILTILLFWVAGLALWLFGSNYARKETVSGWLEPPQGVIRIYPEDAGIIKDILVSEGDLVEPGQVLLVVDGDHFLEGGDRLEARLLEEYEAQQQLLQDQLTLSSSIYERRQQDIKERILVSEQGLILLAEQIYTLNDRHQLAQDLVERNQKLHNQGYVSATDLENIIAQELSLHSEKQSLMREKLNLLNSQDQLKTELALLPDQNANEEVQFRARLSDITQKIAQLSGQRSYVIKATCACRVSNLQVHVGEKVYAGSAIPLLTIYPREAQLSANLLVPVRSAGFVEAGQVLDIRYDAFPYQKFGLYVGEVINISDTILMPDELLNTPLRIEEPVYRITALLKQPNVQAYGRDFSLKAGMTLSADVRLEERSLLQWLLEPIHSMRGRL